MPISIDRFDEEPAGVLDLQEGTQPYRILQFLAENSDQAFTQTEIHEATDIKRGSVGGALSRLEDRGLVRHRGRYWAIAEDDRLASYAAQMEASSSSTADDYYGEEWSMGYERGVVVKGPDPFADYDHRPYVWLSDDTHPFSDEEALYAAVTTTRRAVAIPLTGDDFTSGGLPQESYVNLWTVASIRHADIEAEEGRLANETIEKIAQDAAGYLGVR